MKDLEPFFQKKISEIQEATKNLKHEKQLSIHEMNEIPEIKKIIEEMRSGGITRQWLQDKGFIVASIMLNI